MPLSNNLLMSEWEWQNDNYNTCSVYSTYRCKDKILQLKRITVNNGAKFALQTSIRRVISDTAIIISLIYMYKNNLP